MLKLYYSLNLTVFASSSFTPARSERSPMVRLAYPVLMWPTPLLNVIFRSWLRQGWNKYYEKKMLEKKVREVARRNQTGVQYRRPALSYYWRIWRKSHGGGEFSFVFTIAKLFVNFRPREGGGGWRLIVISSVVTSTVVVVVPGRAVRYAEE